MYGIIGSGFGLYGYLPIILNQFDKVLLLHKSKEILLARSDISHFYKRIIWVETIDEISELANSLIISVPPFIQHDLIIELLKSKNCRSLILEKPLSVSPVESIKLLKKLSNSGIFFKISYLFIYTDWFELLKNNAEILSKGRQNYSINILWNFKAHHYKTNQFNWKRSVQEGGGVIRFYGIHLIAILSAMNFDKVTFSKALAYNFNDIHTWKADFASSNGFAKAEITVNSNCDEEKFEIVIQAGSNSERIYELQIKNPFDENNNKDIDIRHCAINKYIYEFELKNNISTQLNFYRKVNSLWMEIENNLQYTVN